MAVEDLAHIAHKCVATLIMFELHNMTLCNHMAEYVLYIYNLKGAPPSYLHGKKLTYGRKLMLV